MKIQKSKETKIQSFITRRQPGQKHREDLQRLSRFRLFDDNFLTKCFEGDTDCIELVLQIILEKPDLKVLDVRTQVFNLLQKSEDFDALPETWVIFITENDVIGKGLPLYQIERCFLETGEKFGDDSHILYVNGAYRSNTPIGKLMHDFSCSNAEDMYYRTLADKVRFFKENKEGIEIMCRAMEDMRNQTLREGMTEVALRMLAAGKYALKEIVTISGLSPDEVKLLKAAKNV